jgi:uncharacterized membrane protein
MRAFARMGLPLIAIGLAGVSVSMAGQEENLYAILAGLGCFLSITLAGMAIHPMAGAGIASLVGSAIGLYLATQHVVSNLPGHSSLCNISATLDCDRVNTSQWSELLGLPTGLWAGAFYAAIAVLSLNAWRERPGYDRAPVLVFGGGVLAVVFSAFLAWESAKLGAWCLFCISLYLVALLVLVAGALAAREHEYLTHLRTTLLGHGDRSSGVALTAGTLVLLLGGATHEALGGSPPTSDPENYSLVDFYEQLSGELVLSGKEPEFGRPDAKYTVVEFASYSCPHCAELAAPIKKLIARHSDLKLVHKLFVFDGHSPLPAQAAWCAHQQGRFWEMNDLLFANIGFTDRADLAFMAEKQIGLDPEMFSTCLDDPASLEATQADTNAGRDAGLQGTPTLYLGGAVPGEDWVKIVNGLDDAVDLLLVAAGRGEELPAAGAPGSQESHETHNH